MKDKLESFNYYLASPVSFGSRLLLIAAVLVLIPALFLPLWHLDFGAQQYPEGLELFIYPDGMEGGDDGNDLTEINVLNHYIGMAELKTDDFTEFKWIPLIIGLLFVITLRAAVVGTLKSAVDILVFTAYFSIFSLWRFWSMLYSYGHNLDPKAAVKVDPFTPPVFGTKMVGQFTVASYPSSGSIFFMLFILLIMSAIYLTYKQSKQNPEQKG